MKGILTFPQTSVGCRLLAALMLGCGFGMAAANGPLPVELNLRLSASGYVYAMARQADGGLIVGGLFATVDGVSRRNLARLTPDGSLDSIWNPSPNNTITTVVVGADGAVFVGGRFSVIGGQSRSNIAKLSGEGEGDADTSWNPTVGGYVDVTALDDEGHLYVAGQFGNVGGLDRQSLARLSVVGNGSVDPVWNPRVVGRVHAIQPSHQGAVFVGGDFTSVGGVALSNIAKLSTAGSGAADALWNPSASGTVRALALGRDASLFVGGSFSIIGGVNQSYLAKLSSTGAGAVDVRWGPTTALGVSTLSVDQDGDLYAGGLFAQVETSSSAAVAKFRGAGSGVPDPGWHPVTDAGISVVVADEEGSAFVGGAFTRVGGHDWLGVAHLGLDGKAISGADFADIGFAQAIAVQPDGGAIVSGYFNKVGATNRNRLFRLNRDLGVDQEWNPNPDGQIQAIAVALDGAVYVGGLFRRVGGQARSNLARLSGSGTGDADPDWDPAPDSIVNALAIDESNSVLVGGWFQNVGGVPRSCLARISSEGTGAVDEAWNLNFDGGVQAISLSTRSTVFVGGFFSTVDGLPRRGIVKLRVGALEVIDPNWAPAVSGDVFSIVSSVDDIYIGGSFTTIDNVPHARLAKLSATGIGMADAHWAPRANAPVNALVLDSNGSIFAGGAFTEVDGQQRDRLARLSATGNGKLDIAWNPGVGFTPAWPPYVHALGMKKNGHLLVGGEFISAAARPLSGFAVFDDGILADGFEH